MSVLIAVTFLTVPTSYAGDDVYGSGKPLSIKQTNDGHITSSPDINKSPSSDSVIPIPYPHIGESKETIRGRKKLKLDRKPTGTR